MASSMTPVLPVMPIDPTFDPSKTPSTGEEFLQYVIYERQHCAEIVTVPLDESNLKKQMPAIKVHTHDKAVCPSNLLPTEEWQLYQIAHFQKMRDKIERIANRNENLGIPIPYPSTALEQLYHKARQNKEICKTFFCSRKPTLDIVYHVSQGTWLNLFEVAINLFEDVYENVQKKEKNTNSKYLQMSVEDTENSYGWLCIWLYAGLLHLKTPLSPEMHDVIRRILRMCAKLRSVQPPESTFLDTVELTIPICIISRYFNQKDLAD